MDNITDFTSNQMQSAEQLHAKVPYAFNKVIVNDAADCATFTVSSPIHSIRSGVSEIHTSLHHHDYFEIVVVLSGSLTQIIEGTSYHYSAGQCCILNRNINHAEIYHHRSVVLFIMLTEDFLLPLIDKNFIYSTNNLYPNAFDSISHLIEKNKKNKYYTSKEYINFSPSQDITEGSAFMEHLVNITNEMISRTISHHPGCTYMIAGLIELFFSFLVTPRYYKKKMINLIETNEEKLFHQITNIFQSSKDRISRIELEKELHYSSDYLNKLVKKMTGMTLVEYSQVFRLQKAEDFLVNSDRKIYSIALELGFSNRTYFNRIFAKRYGMTPSQYRISSKKRS